MTNQFDSLTGKELLEAIYNTPSKEFSTEQITAYFSARFNREFSANDVRALFNQHGFRLRERNKITKVEKVAKEKRVSGINTLLNLFPVENVETIQQQEEVSPAWYNEEVYPDVDEAGEVFNENNVVITGVENGIYN